jgi:D-alanyl-lipoteichoic acid acyltransferase DltB (MBOAT superfamily)
MLFNSFPFGIFFAAVFIAASAIPRRHKAALLLAASLVFYGLWSPIFLPLLLGTIAVNHLLARKMATSVHRRTYLVLSVVVTLSLLAFFKYAAFAVGLVRTALPALHVKRSSLDFILPLGISFYSFEIISLSVDIYRGRIRCPSFRDYALFVTFFPHLIAGPIMRGSELLPQLDAGGARSAARTRRGAWLFAVGLAKKTIISDYLLLPFVTEVFAVPGAASGPVHLVAIYSFTFQIYFDFSGYTDMARGAACVLGFELPQNFAEPYLSRDIAEFWSRWHVTLSRWLRDYLYVPLGGSRHGSARTLLNLMLTMFLGGLWHGAGLNFVAWGGMHGVFLVVTRLFGSKRPEERGPIAWSDVPAIIFTFHLVAFSLIPFRAGTWSDSVAFAGGLFRGGYLGGWPILPLAIVAICGALHVAERFIRARLPQVHARLAGAAWGPLAEGALLGAVASMAVLASGAGVEFIYFQF